MFTPQLKTLNELFQSDIKYIIPDYQRPYSWDSIDKSNKNNQVNVMWNDLYAYFKSDQSEPYFLGSMVLIGRDEAREFVVVDGQQRLTTIVLLFSAIRCFIKNVLVLEENKELNEFVRETELVVEGLIFNKKALGIRTTEKKVKIERNLGFDYDSILEAALNCQETSIQNANSEQKQVSKRFTENRKFFEEKLIDEFSENGTLTQKNAEDLDKFMELLKYKISVIRILTENQKVAFKIFEILNNRGLPLSNKDLFRNFIISEFDALKRSNEIKYADLDPKKKWHELDDDDALNDDFLSRFVESVNASQQRFSAFNDIQDLYKNDYTDIPLKGAKIENFYTDLIKYFNHYLLITNHQGNTNKKIANKIAFLRNAGNERYSTNLLLSLFHTLNYDGKDNTEVLDFIEVFEKHLLYIIIGPSKRFSNSPIYKAIKLINDSKINEAKELFLLTENENRDLVKIINGDFKDNDTAKLLIAKYLWWQDSTEDTDVVVQSFYFDKSTLEHIIPQQPEKDTNWTRDFDDNFKKRYTYKLGNMTLLTQSMNSKGRNFDYDKKKKIYDKTKLKLTATLPDTISQVIIEKRQEMIVNGILTDLKLEGLEKKKNNNSEKKKEEKIETSEQNAETTTEKSLNFIEEIVETWLEANPGKTILTRFPPEPNGYLHIGHAKSICLNFGLAKKYGGATNLRFDDTNPVKEDVEYVDSIREDVKWLGFDWKQELYASDYFDELYGYAVQLIEKGLAYVDFSTQEEIATQKGTPTTVGTNSPFRDTSVEENLTLFAKMKNGEFEDGKCTLRAKIDMAHVNMHMRDPLMYRIKHAHHHRTGDAWCIYPMYDFAHGQSDSIENITHSVCTLEFIPHRELYDWYIASLGIFTSKQYEFARLNLNYTVMSKRYLLKLVNENVVNGWDDPRMPTISGLRRRGYTPASLREFCDRIGIAKRENTIDVSMLEFCVRQDLENTAHRVMAVMDPIKLVIVNYEGEGENLNVENIPGNEVEGSHTIPFSREVWIERDDFMIDPPKGYFRLMPNPDHVVRLKYAYIIQYVNHVVDENGNVTEVHVKYHANSKSGEDQSGIKVKTALHWVSANAFNAEVRLYDRLFVEENPNTDSETNPNSLTINSKALLEPYCATAEAGKSYQFFRLGYFCLDKDSSDSKMVFNKTVGLKDSFTKK